MNFLKHREISMVSYQVSSFLLNSAQQRTIETVRGCVSLKKYKSQGKAVAVTLISKDKTFKTFVQEFGLGKQCEICGVGEGKAHHRHQHSYAGGIRNTLCKDDLALCSYCSSSMFSSPRLLGKGKGFSAGISNNLLGARNQVRIGLL